MVAMRICLLAGLVVVAGALGGCRPDLFPKDEPRSQYERYMQLRGEQTQTTEKNRFGGDEILLRERLKPLQREW